MHSEWGVPRVSDFDAVGRWEEPILFGHMGWYDEFYELVCNRMLYNHTSLVVCFLCCAATSVCGNQSLNPKVVMKCTNSFVQATPIQIMMFDKITRMQINFPTLVPLVLFVIQYFVKYLIQKQCFWTSSLHDAYEWRTISALRFC